MINGACRPHGVAIESAARFVSSFGKLFKEHEILSFVFGTDSTPIRGGVEDIMPKQPHASCPLHLTHFTTFALDVYFKGLST